MSLQTNETLIRDCITLANSLPGKSGMSLETCTVRIHPSSLTDSFRTSVPSFTYTTLDENGEISHVLRDTELGDNLTGAYYDFTVEGVVCGSPIVLIIYDHFTVPNISCNKAHLVSRHSESCLYLVAIDAKVGETATITIEEESSGSI